MNTKFNLTILKTSSLAIMLLSSLFSGSVAYAVSTDYKSIPASILTPDARPIVMLTMTNDHQLFYKAYTDFDDIIKADGTVGTDGTIETTYTDVFNYYGYFDSKKCYAYSVLSGRFNPVADAAGTNDHNCSGVAAARWNGNFLNWLTMSRMDIVRKVLHGGKRSTDSATETVLERAYIPNDNHAWAKFYPAADINDYTPYSSADDATGLTFCNVTPYDGVNEYSQGTTSTPRLRIAKGKWDNWAAQERIQCFWDGEAPLNRTNADTPNLATEGLADLTVRVKVCDSALLGSETCRQYGAVYKPSGLLQKYAEIGAIDFGLITGSYEKGKSGGVLRKNISPIINLDNLDTSIDEIDTTTGQFTAVNGIISTLNKLRISRYSYNDNGYGAASVDDCPYGQNTWNNGECANWGNPMGEIYLEALRYLSGAAAAHSDFAAPNDATWLPGIATSVTWRDPYGSAQAAPAGGGYPACAKPNIINFSTGVLGFDHDEYSGQSDVGGTLNVNTETNTVGATELNAANTYYVGNTNSVGSAGDTCSAQAIAGNNLSIVTGLCPEAAGLQGSFKIAGLAYYAHGTDLRSGVDGNQTVDTYSIALAPPIPDIKVNVGGNTVRIIPVGRNWRNNNAMVLVNFQIISQTATSGEFFMNYENAPAGADHDSDFKGYLSYVVSGNDISITAHNTGSSAGSTMHMGYIIDGVTDPGVHYVASNKNVTLTNSTGGGSYTVTKAAIDTACGALTLPASGSLDRCTTNIAGGVNRDLRGARTHTAGASSTVLLKSPLWYAAKWGNFEDLNSDNIPGTTDEWDTKNNLTGAFIPDGVPDNYFLVTNPAILETQLESALSDILQRISSGSAAAVIADSLTTAGSLYQALYQPTLILDGKKITWAGQVHAILIDKYSNLREDTNGNKTLDTNDKYIKVKYSPDQKRTQIWYCTPGGSPLGTTKTCPTTDRKEISELKPLWNARDELAIFSATDTRLVTQRTYATPFSDSGNGGRYIFTWQDNNGDNVLDSGETVDFTESNFPASKAGLLGVTSATAATEPAKIVNFIRGYENPSVTGYRSRTIDYDNDNVDEVWRLGDIVHSSPVTAGPPDGVDYAGEKISWNDNGDATYLAFKNQYKNRRTMLYLGANDGLIHAFNAGFYKSSTQQYCLDNACLNDSTVSHTLGAEIWAYAPRNLLPQLKFLTEEDYPHVYYMDGEPQIFDVNIFPDDAVHPQGWGTILVVGMRLGGGAHNPITVDVDNTGTTTFETNSAYVILDVTDPESPPTLLGEFTHADLGFTTSTPTLTVKRAPSASGNWNVGATSINDWGLVFGSGPNQLDTGLSTQNAKLFFVKLELSSGVLDLSASNQFIIDTTITNSFIGDPMAKNWSGDFKFDAVYFGVAGGTELIPTGRLMRVALNGDNSASWSLSTMINPAQPFLNAPLAKIHTDGEWWVYAGTGRLFSNIDNLSVRQQSFYGLKETPDSTYVTSPSNKLFSTNTAATNHIQNSTGVIVNPDESLVIPAGLSSEYSGVTNFTELKTHMAGKAGWYRNFDIPLYAERDLARATYFSGLIVYPGYTPNFDTCTSEGYSSFYYIYEKTGTNYINWPTKSGTFFGITSEVSVIKDIDGNYKIFNTTTTGEVVEEDPDPDCLPNEPCSGNPPSDGSTGRQSWREIILY